MSKSVVIAQLQEENQRLHTEVAALRQLASSIAGTIECREYIEKLQRSEALYKSLFEISNEGIYRWQLSEPVSLSLSTSEQVEQIYQNYYFAEGNIALAAMYGFTKAEDIIGLRISNTHVADSDKNRKFVRDCVENGYRIRNVESEEIDINGQKHYFLNSVISFIENNCVIGGWGTQIDITELRSKEQALLNDAIERERLLQTITTVANQLLRAADYTTTLPEVLRSLGEAAFSDRCYLVENLRHPQTEQLAVRLHTEWCRSGVTASIDITPELAESAGWENFPGVQEKLIQGEMVTLWVDELPSPSRSEFKKQGNIAMTLVPILVKEKFWGVFGFDYCSEMPLFDVAHKAIFTIAVDCIAAAIERQEKDTELKLIQQTALEASQEKVAHLASMNQALMSRDRILAATAQATNSLFTLENFDGAVNTALQILGEELDADRVGLMENFNPQQEPSSLYYQVIYEWNSPGTVPQFSSQVAASGNYADIEWLYESFRLGQTASYQISEAPEPFRTKQISIGVKSSHLVPIYVEGNWWGVLRVDDCREAKHRSTAELAALKIAANCVGSAIERKRNQQALLTTEQEKVARLASINQTLHERERLLETTATAANALLTTDNFDDAVNCALQIIGESLDTDRVVIIDHFDQPLEILPGWRILYEWDSEGTISQISHPRVAQGTYDGIEAFYESLNTGHSLSCLLEDMSEPFRSGQAELGVKAIHVIPIFIEGKFWGHAGFDDCRQAKHRSQAELAALKIAANCIGSAIERKRSQQALLRAEQERVAAIACEQEKAATARVAQLATANTALKKTLDVLATEPELDKSLGHVLQVTTEHLGSSSAALWLYNQNTNTFAIDLVYLNGNIIAATPENAHLLTNQWIRRRDLSQDLILKDHIHSRVPVLYDVLESPKVSVGQRQFFRNLGIQTLLGVPLLLGSEIVGSFTVRFNEKRLLQAEELELTQALAHQATLAIQLLRMAEEAKINVLLEERNRMAGEIHDTLAQGFTGIITYLEAGSRAAANQNFVKVQSCVDNALQTARSSLQEARRSVWALRPQALEVADLSIALHNWVEHLKNCTNIEINTQGEPCDLSPEVDRELLRIAQEAVVNALKHAQAAKITLDLIWQQAYVTLSITDNGQGFVLQRTLNRGFGLISMQQRASRIGGQLMICSEVGQGAQISVTIPINANPIIEVKHEFG